MAEAWQQQSRKSAAIFAADRDLDVALALVKRAGTRLALHVGAGTVRRVQTAEDEITAALATLRSEDGS